MLFDENPQYILAETHNGKLARSKVYPNDVLMNIVGPPLGKFTLVTDEFEEWNINQAIAIFRAKERILPRFLLHALMQPKVLEPFIGQAVGIRQQNLSLEQCRNLQFPLPSLEEQKSFVEFAEQLDKSKFVERFPELSLFFKAFSLLNSEMICIFPYFCPCEIIVREIREISFSHCLPPCREALLNHA